MLKEILLPYPVPFLCAVIRQDGETTQHSYYRYRLMPVRQLPLLSAMSLGIPAALMIDTVWTARGMTAEVVAGALLLALAPFYLWLGRLAAGVFPWALRARDDLIAIARGRRQVAWHGYLNPPALKHVPVVPILAVVIAALLAIVMQVVEALFWFIDRWFAPRTARFDAARPYRLAEKGFRRFAIIPGIALFALGGWLVLWDCPPDAIARELTKGMALFAIGLLVLPFLMLLELAPNPPEKAIWTREARDRLNEFFSMASVTGVQTSTNRIRRTLLARLIAPARGWEQDIARFSTKANRQEWLAHYVISTQGDPDGFLKSGWLVAVHDLPVLSGFVILGMSLALQWYDPGAFLLAFGVWFFLSCTHIVLESRGKETQHFTAPEDYYYGRLPVELTRDFDEVEKMRAADDIRARMQVTWVGAIFSVLAIIILTALPTARPPEACSECGWPPAGFEVCIIKEQPIGGRHVEIAGNSRSL